jgi:uncharacterized protein with HEPN domain
MNRDIAYVAYMKDAIRKIEVFTVDMSQDEFLRDEKTQSAVMLQLMLLGEMAKKVSDDTKVAIALPWKEIAGFRDRAIHDYYDMDLDIVWDTVVQDIPTLKKNLA